MQGVIIDPSWEFVDAVNAAWRRYTGGVEGMARRTTVLRTWGAVVGRERALRGLAVFLEESGGAGKAAQVLGMSPTTLRAVRQYFNSLPEDSPHPELNIIARTEAALQSGEGPTVEFKEGLPPQLRDLAKEVAALATSGGGLVILGVRDDGSLAGFDQPRERVDGIVQLVNPTPRARIEVVTLFGQNLCVIDVAKGDAPLYYVQNCPYIRDGAVSRPATDHEVITTIQEWSSSGSQR